jgi:hypothetical protein
MSQIGQETAAIGDVNQVDACHYLEQLTKNMGRRPDTGRGHIDFARIGLGVGNELRDRLGRHRWIDHHDKSATSNAPDRCDVTDEIVIEVRVERRVDQG